MHLAGYIPHATAYNWLPPKPDPARMGIGDHPLPGNDPPEVGDLDYHVERFLERVFAVCALLALFGIPALVALLLAGCSPLDAPPATSIVTGDVTVDTAASNRASIEGVAVVTLPAGVVKLDRAAQPANGQTITGGELVNAFTSDGTYGRTLLCDPDAGIGYFDKGKVTGSNQFTLKDPSQIVKYVSSDPIYLWLLDGFQPPGSGTLRTLHEIQSVNRLTGAINLLPGGPSLDSRINAAKWFFAASTVGDPPAGTVNLLGHARALGANAGDWLMLTEGPSVANVGRCEFGRLDSARGDRISLLWPTQRSYAAAVVAKVQPVVGVTLKNLTLDKPAALDTALVKYGVAWRLDSVVARGTFNMVSCANWTATGCTFDTLSLNSCSNCVFLNCSIKRLTLEECCFANRFEGCVLGGVSTTTQCERLTITGCRITEFCGLTGDSMTIDATTLDVAGVYLMGDRCRLSNITGGFVFVQKGSGGLVTRCPGVELGYPSYPSDGVCLDSPGATVKAGTWRVIP